MSSTICDRTRSSSATLSTIRALSPPSNTRGGRLRAWMARAGDDWPRVPIPDREVPKQPGGPWDQYDLIFSSGRVDLSPLLGARAYAPITVSITRRKLPPRILATAGAGYPRASSAAGQVRGLVHPLEPLHDVLQEVEVGADADVVVAHQLHQGVHVVDQAIEARRREVGAGPPPLAAPVLPLEPERSRRCRPPAGRSCRGRARRASGAPGPGAPPGSAASISADEQWIPITPPPPAMARIEFVRQVAPQRGQPAHVGVRGDDGVPAQAAPRRRSPPRRRARRR